MSSGGAAFQDERRAGAPGRQRSWSLFRRLWRESLRHHLRTLIFAFLCMAAVAGASSAQTYLMGPLIDKVFIARDGSLLWLIAAGIVAIFAVRSLARYLQEVLLVRIGQKIVADTQDRLFRKMMRQDMDLYRSRAPGSLAAVFTYDVNTMRLAVCDVFLTAGKDALTILMMIGLMVYTDWRMALACLVLPVLSILPMKYLGRAMRRISLQTQDAMGALTQSLTQSFQGIRLVKSFRLEAVEEARAASQMSALARLVIRGAWVGGAILPVVDGLGGLAVATVIIYGGAQVIAGALTPGQLFVFVGAIVGAYAPVPSISKVNAVLQTGLAAAERVFALMDQPSTILASEAAPALPRISGSVQFENVRFAYAADAPPALKGINFTAPAGSVTALVGPTGAGKSTVLNLIQRFHDPDQGRVLVNGVDVRAASVASLRDCIAVVSQDVTLFDDTIANNIRHGRLEATDAEVEAAALAAGCQDLVSQTPLGLATRVGDNGLRLSEGQRQRISIARALLRDAPILLLDEATSAQDAMSERRLQRIIKQLTLGRTVIVVAHRLETLKDADLIHVLDEGKVEESGTHHDLVDERGLYARLDAARKLPWSHALPGLEALASTNPSHNEGGGQR